MAGVESLRLSHSINVAVLSLMRSKMFKTQVGAAEHKHYRITGTTFLLPATKQIYFGVQCLVIAKYLLLQLEY